MGFFGSIWDTIKGTAAEAKKMTVDKATELGSDLAKKGQETVKQTMGTVSNYVDDATKAGKGALDQAVDKVSDVSGDLANKGKDMLEKGASTVETYANKAADAGQNALDKTADKVEDVAKAAEKKVDNIK